MALMRTYIAGVNHRPGAKERLAQILPGETLTLAREPDNAYDKNAVAVYDGDKHLGYVPAVDAPAIAKALLETRVVTRYVGAPASTSISIAWGVDVDGSAA
jgi:hypothetical protein